MKRLNLLGERFGRLLVVKKAKDSLSGHTQWLCKCDCGKITLKKTTYLRCGDTKSCGCYQVDKARSDSTTHGLHGIPEYSVLRSMIDRCHLPSNHAYERYGGRGITVCKRWRFGAKGKSGIECFIEDMGRRPEHRLTVERVNNNNGYSKMNCKWATYSEQARNRRPDRVTRQRNKLGQWKPSKVLRRVK